MTITREQVADLRPGDVVEFWHEDWPQGTTLTGPIYEYGEELHLGPDVVRFSDGDILARYARGGHLTVVSRAPRPLYVNHDRTEPVEGDVFQSEYSQWPLWIAGKERIAEHKAAESCRWIGRDDLPDRLRLLVDGETGRCVP